MSDANLTFNTIFAYIFYFFQVANRIGFGAQEGKTFGFSSV